MYVVQASSLTKIFMAEWTQKCIEDPSIIDQDVPFTVRIPRPSGGIVLQHNKPVHASSLIPQSKTRKVEDDEVTPLVYWLTGGPEQRPSEETDIYGVVMIDVGGGFERSMQDLLELTLASRDPEKREKSMQRLAQLQNGVVKSMDEQLIEGKKRADARVKAALSINHSNLIKSWESLKGEGKGQYTPSATESLGYFILKAEIDRKLEMQRRLYSNISEGIPGQHQSM